MAEKKTYAEKSEGCAHYRERLPRWFLQPVRSNGDMREVEALLKNYQLHTVCQSAKCPNRMECFSRRTATFMIMGDICTRHCSFCGVKKGKPFPLDPLEPVRVAEVSKKLNLEHVVVTSVTRDDLADGGAAHFGETVRAIKGVNSGASVEVLIPDFKGREESILEVISAGPEVLNHNIETVERLYPMVRSEAAYRRSLEVLETAKRVNPQLITKSGVMVGLGEEWEDLTAAFEDLAKVGCDILTLGQYLRPSQENLEVERFYKPAEFARLEKLAREAGIKEVVAAPLVRSSYRAKESMERITGKVTFDAKRRER